MKNQVLITGGAGFIGGHLLKALVRDGNNVRCLVNNKNDIAHIENLGAKAVPGDLMDKASLIAAVKNVNTVYHLAANVRPHKTFFGYSELPSFYNKVNVEGTKNLADACLKSTVERFINFSSIAAAGLGIGLSENSPCDPITNYGKSKLEAEKYLLELHTKKQFPVIIIRPGQIYGPGNFPMLTLFRFVKHGILPSFGKGLNKLPFCYVENLIAGTLLAENKGKTGEVYYLYDEHLQLREFATIIADQLDVKLSGFYIPICLAKFGIGCKEILEKILSFHLCPFCMSVDNTTLKITANDWTFTNDKAKRELGYKHSISTREGIDRTIHWYKENGYL